MANLTTYVRNCRRDDEYLRVTWHAGPGTIVLSHWTDEICTASTPIALADAPVLIELLVAALADAAANAVSAPAPQGLLDRIRSGLQMRVRPQLAQVVPLWTQRRSEKKHRARAR